MVTRVEEVVREEGTVEGEEVVIVGISKPAIADTASTVALYTVHGRKGEDREQARGAGRQRHKGEAAVGVNARAGISSQTAANSAVIATLCTTHQQRQQGKEQGHRTVRQHQPRATRRQQVLTANDYEVGRQAGREAGRHRQQA